MSVLSGAILIVGCGFVVVGGVGLLRFPDFFTRLHAASVTDTMGAGLVLLGLMLVAGWSVPTIKLVLILVFLVLTSPAAAHALAKAALHGGLQPMVSEEPGAAAASEGEEQ